MSDDKEVMKMEKRNRQSKGRVHGGDKVRIVPCYVKLQRLKTADGMKLIPGTGYKTDGGEISGKVFECAIACNYPSSDLFLVNIYIV